MKPMKTTELSDVLKNKVKEYLDNINVKYNEDEKLSELLEIVRKRNSSNPDRAVGGLLIVAVKEYEDISNE